MIKQTPMTEARTAIIIVVKFEFELTFELLFVVDFEVADGVEIEDVGEFVEVGDVEDIIELETVVDDPNPIWTNVVVVDTLTVKASFVLKAAPA